MTPSCVMFWMCDGGEMTTTQMRDDTLMTMIDQDDCRLWIESSGQTTIMMMDNTA